MHAERPKRSAPLGQNIYSPGLGEAKPRDKGSHKISLSPRRPAWGEGREGLKELRERLEHVPLERGGHQGGHWKPQVLIQQCLPPQVPLGKGGRLENNELLQGLTNFFTASG